MTADRSPSAWTRGLCDCRVLRRRDLCREHYELTLLAEAFPPAQPGQFLQILCRSNGPSAPDRSTGAGRGHASGTTGFLRRPFSIGGLRRTEPGVELDIIGRIVGPGTAWLDARRPGDVVNVLGPLGRPFSMPPPGVGGLLVAGGVGLPPIRWLGLVLRAAGIDTTVIIGARTRDLLPVHITVDPDTRGDPTHCVDEYAACGAATIVTTDDGTCGLRGRTTDALRRLLERDEARRRWTVYACGPQAMLHGVADLCRERRVGCELALERVMGCGMGTCQSCVVAVRSNGGSGWRYALCCTEGPVFDAARIVWSQ